MGCGKKSFAGGVRQRGSVDGGKVFAYFYVEVFTIDYFQYIFYILTLYSDEDKVTVMMLSFDLVSAVNKRLRTDDLNTLWEFSLVED